MSPEVFGAAKSNAPAQIKEEPATPVEVSPPKRGAAITMAAMASGGSSPSREVQDILGDTEEQGGLGAEIGRYLLMILNSLLSGRLIQSKNLAEKY